MSVGSRLVSHVHGIYEAATDATRWPSVLRQLADEFRGGVAGFQDRIGDGVVRRADFVGVDPAVLRRIRTEYSAANPWVRATQPLYRTGAVFALDDLVPLSRLRRTGYYTDVVRPSGVVHGFGACVERIGDRALSFTVVRSGRRGPFQDWELRQVELLLPHVRRAYQVNGKLAQLRALHAASTDGLDALRHGVFVVDKRGRVTFANREARRIVGLRDGLTTSRDGLEAAEPGEQRRMRALIADALRTRTGAGLGAGGSIAISRPSSRAPFAVTVAPVAFETGDVQHLESVTVFVSDLAAGPPWAQSALRRQYGLSAREASVTQSLLCTGDLGRTAESLHMLPETARWHLKRIFRKTDTHRQVELLRLFLGGATCLRVEGENAWPREERRVP